MLRCRRAVRCMHNEPTAARLLVADKQTLGAKCIGAWESVEFGGAGKVLVRQFLKMLNAKC